MYLVLVACYSLTNLGFFQEAVKTAIRNLDCTYAKIEDAFHSQEDQKIASKNIEKFESEKKESENSETEISSDNERYSSSKEGKANFFIA